MRGLPFDDPHNVSVALRIFRPVILNDAKHLRPRAETRLGQDHDVKAIGSNLKEQIIQEAHFKFSGL